MALTNSSILLGLTFPLWITSIFTKTKRLTSKKLITITTLIVLVTTAFFNQPFLGSIQLGEAANPNQEIHLTIDSRISTAPTASDIYVVNGGSYAHINELVNLMGSNGLLFYKSNTTGDNKGPAGLIAHDDFVLI